VSTQPTPTPDTNRPPTTTATATPLSTSACWTDKCQPQFDTQHADPLKNLIDDRNAARLDADYAAGTPTVTQN
jgi:hypothetical protein